MLASVNSSAAFWDTTDEARVPSDSPFSLLTAPMSFMAILLSCKGDLARG